MAQRVEAGAMIYEIRVDGRLDPARLADYAAVTARHQEAGTVLTCAIVDASALTGMIALIADLGLIVRDVHQVSAGASVTPSSDSSPR
ncbi:hypothetical protein [Isoptericola sp. QY 916]|uniref:hypothetical protein n=1 Tax=Isoptericola sp. QY 916 TaxID=2782570 RepID=UPI003D2FB494|nr:hypothetical protein [Isoptericola sp. QY 916]